MRRLLTIGVTVRTYCSLPISNTNVSWVNIPTHTTVDVDQEDTKPCTSSSLKSALSMPTNSLSIQMFQRRLNTLFIASSSYRSYSGLSKAVSEAKKNVN